jgi:hypothetical protein
MLRGYLCQPKIFSHHSVSKSNEMRARSSEHVERGGALQNKSCNPSSQFMRDLRLETRMRHYSKLFPVNIMSRRNYSEDSKKSKDEENRETKNTYSEQIKNTLYSLKEDLKNSSYVNEMNDLVNHVFTEMEKKQYNMLRIKITIGIILLLIIFAMYDLIIGWTSKQVNVITEKSLDDPTLRQKLSDLCIERITQLTESEDIQNQVTQLLKVAVWNLAQDPETQDKLADLFVVILTSDKVKKATADSITDLVTTEDYEPWRNNLHQFLIKEINKLTSAGSIQNDVGKLMSRSVLSIFWKRK